MLKSMFVFRPIKTQPSCIILQEEKKKHTVCIEYIWFVKGLNQAFNEES